jgi:hypothetical protein
MVVIQRLENDGLAMSSRILHSIPAALQPDLNKALMTAKDAT